VAGQARKANMMPKEKLEWQLLLLRVSRRIRVREASIAVNQAKKNHNGCQKRSFDGIYSCCESTPQNYNQRSFGCGE